MAVSTSHFHSCSGCGPETKGGGRQQRFKRLAHISFRPRPRWTRAAAQAMANTPFPAAGRCRWQVNHRPTPNESAREVWLRQRVSARPANPRGGRRSGGGGDSCCRAGGDRDADMAAGRCHPPDAVRCRPRSALGGRRCRVICGASKVQVPWCSSQCLS